MPSKTASATGRPIGKAGARSMRKNDDAIRRLLDMLATAKNPDDLLAIIRDEGFIIGRVIRPMGGGRIVVSLQTGDTDVSVPIAGAVRLHGKAGSKTDRSYCMCADDFIVIRGGQAVAKIPLGIMAGIRESFKRCDLELPHSFSEKMEEEVGDYLFDRSEELFATDSAAANLDEEIDIDNL